MSGLARLMRAALLAALALAPSGAGGAEQPLALTYLVHFGGATIMQIDARLALAEQGGSRYSVAVAGHTLGLLDRIKPLAFAAHSEGLAQDRGLQPARYTTRTDKRDKSKEVTIAFRPGGTPEARFTPAPDDPIEPLPPELAKGILDPASALVAVLQKVAETGSCAGTVPVFDGKRRFDLDFSAGGSQGLKPSDYSIFSGPAQRCEVSLVPRHGFEEDKPGKLPQHATVWFGEVFPDAPPLPVRIDTQNQISAVRVHLVRAGSAQGLSQTR